MNEQEIIDLYNDYFENWPFTPQEVLYSFAEFKLLIENGMKYEKKTT